MYPNIHFARRKAVRFLRSLVSTLWTLLHEREPVLQPTWILDIQSPLQQLDQASPLRGQALLGNLEIQVYRWVSPGPNKARQNHGSLLLSTPMELANINLGGLFNCEERAKSTRFLVPEMRGSMDDIPTLKSTRHAEN